MNLSYYKKPRLPPAYSEEFRDPIMWQFLREEILPQLKQNRVIRIWSAGCASGEEAISLVSIIGKGSIYATDIREDIFIKHPKVRFRVHDLVADPPLKYMSLVLCRNVLMFFKPEYQNIICDNLYNSLRTGGFLVLGKAENVRGEAAKKLIPINHSLRIYQRVLYPG